MKEEPKFFTNRCKICKTEFAYVEERDYCGLCILNYGRLKKFQQ